MTTVWIIQRYVYTSKLVLTICIIVILLHFLLLSTFYSLREKLQSLKLLYSLFIFYYLIIISTLGLLFTIFQSLLLFFSLELVKISVIPNFILMPNMDGELYCIIQLKHQSNCYTSRGKRERSRVAICNKLIRRCE